MKKFLYLLSIFILFSQTLMALTTIPGLWERQGYELTISVQKGEWSYFKLLLTNGDRSIELVNLSSDLDLYIQEGSEPTLASFSDRGIQQGTRTEHLTPNIRSGKHLYIGVYGYTQGSATLKIKYLSGVQDNFLAPNLLRPFNIQEGEWLYYRVKADRDNQDFIITIPTMSADVDLYVRSKTYPTLDNYHRRGIQQGTRPEEIKFTLFQGETFYIGIYGYRTATGKIKASYTNNDSEIITYAHDICQNGADRSNPNLDVVCNQEHAPLQPIPYVLVKNQSRLLEIGTASIKSEKILEAPLPRKAFHTLLGKDNAPVSFVDQENKMAVIHREIDSSVGKSAYDFYLFYQSDIRKKLTFIEKNFMSVQNIYIAQINTPTWGIYVDYISNDPTLPPEDQGALFRNTYFTGNPFNLNLYTFGSRIKL